MAILIDKRLEKFIEATEINDVFSIYLKDIDETFHFESEKDVQNFLNRQKTERFGKDELRHYCFYYEDENGIHRYLIDVDNKKHKGRISHYIEEMVTEKEMMEYESESDL